MEKLKKMKKLLTLTFVILSGCATSTGVVPIGKDTFMIAIGGKSIQSGATLKADAFREGSKFCASKGKELQVVNTSQRDMSFGRDPNAEIQFMCLDSQDSELTRPKLKKEADTIIEIKK
jgi:hypothetical protein